MNGLWRASRLNASGTDGRETPPLPAVALAIVAGSFFVLPVVGLVFRAPWSVVWHELTSAEIHTALRLSLVSSLAATVLSVVLGVPLAWVNARVAYRGRRVVRALTTLPMVLPPVVGGVALLLVFGRRGLLGQWLDRGLGVRLPFTTAGAVLAETFVAMPFFILTVEAGLRSVDQRLEEAARTLGARRWAVFWHVTLPLIRPSLVAGAVLTWARALGEFGATITFAGNFPGRTQTMPLAVYAALESRPEAAIVLSLVLLGVSLAVLVSLREQWLGAK
ncbi:MAG: ABC transporter permease [Egibacteraceae bacterium]